VFVWALHGINSNCARISWCHVLRPARGACCASRGTPRARLTRAHHRHRDRPQGEHAHRIWSAIYNQSCFSDGVTCSEERVFYRLISGMHASISTHLTADWLLDEQRGVWGPNLDEFERRLGTPETRCARARVLCCM
jgi:hypothetical protein